VAATRAQIGAFIRELTSQPGRGPNVLALDSGVPRMVKLPWIPAEAEWLRILEVFRGESVRNRVMLALAYDSALRREELRSLRTDDLDPRTGCCGSGRRRPIPGGSG